MCKEIIRKRNKVFIDGSDIGEEEKIEIKKIKNTMKDYSINYKINELKEIFSTPLITNEENIKLDSKQMHNKLTKEEINRENHFYINRQFNLNETENNKEDIIKFVYDNKYLNKYIKNMKYKFDFDSYFFKENIPIIQAEYLEKVKIIDKLLKRIGFDNIFDSKVLDNPEFKK